MNRFLIILSIICLVLIACNCFGADEPDWDKLVSVIIACESSGNPNAVSKTGCIGLMQINPKGALAEFNNFVENLNGEKGIYWFDIEGVDLLNTSNKAHYGWKLTDKKGWYLRVPKYKSSMRLDLYSCPLEEEYLFEPKVNTFVGTWYLKRLRDHYLKDDYTIERLLASYNGGITRLRRLLREGKDWQDMPRESVNYVKKVLNLYRRGK